MERALPPQLWPEEGLCAGPDVDKEIFAAGDQVHSRSDLEVEQAKSYCRQCPMAKRCLAWALENEDFGIWGGTTAGERKVIRRRNTRTVSRAHSDTLSSMSRSSGEKTA